MDHPSYYYSLQLVARTIPVETSWDYNGAQKINVFSFFYSNSVKGNYLDQNTIIINYSHNKLSKQLSFFNSDIYGNGSVMIIDQEGQIIFSTNSYQQVHVPADTFFDRRGLRLLSDPTIQKGQDCIIDREKYYILKRNMDNLGWTIISIVPYRYITGEYSVCIYFTLLFAGMIILFRSVSALAASRYIQQQKQMELQQKNKELRDLEIYYSQQDFLGNPKLYSPASPRKRKKAFTFQQRSIETVAAQWGFSNYIYFHKIFKKNTGVTPGDYRKNNRA